MVGLLQRARRERERASAGAHTAREPHTRVRERQEAALALTPPEESTTSSWVSKLGQRMFEVSLVPWISTSFDKAISKAEKVKGSRALHVACTRSLTPSFKAF